jgi:hypothetical protein
VARRDARDAQTVGKQAEELGVGDKFVGDADAGRWSPVSASRKLLFASWREHRSNLFSLY